MNFIPLFSSSKGNAYLLRSEGAFPLLLECGVPIKQLREKLWSHGIALSDLSGCLISHEHGDHAKAVKDLLKAGVDCYMSLGTAKALGVDGHYRVDRTMVPDFKREIQGTGWNILSFDLNHDAAQPLGFFIGHADDRLLFIPDTAYVESRFSGVTLLAVECNNVAEILARNVQEGHIPVVVGRRVRRNHMSLQNVISMIKANDLSRCRRIYLMHLSDANSDEIQMKEAIERATGIPTEVCGL